MRLSVGATTFASAMLWGLTVFISGLFNVLRPGYAEPFLKMLASIYPGYHASGTTGDMIVGVLYGILDGAIFGLLFAWFYNMIVPRSDSV